MRNLDPQEPRRLRIDAAADLKLHFGYDAERERMLWLIANGSRVLVAGQVGQG